MNSGQYTDKDLNLLRVPFGAYACSFSNGAKPIQSFNYPYNEWGVLLVFGNTLNNGQYEMYVQIFVPTALNKMYFRDYYSGWHSWNEIAIVT